MFQTQHQKHCVISKLTCKLKVQTRAKNTSFEIIFKRGCVYAKEEVNTIKILCKTNKKSFVCQTWWWKSNKNLRISFAEEEQDFGSVRSLIFTEEATFKLVYND